MDAYWGSLQSFWGKDLEQGWGCCGSCRKPLSSLRWCLRRSVLTEFPVSLWPCLCSSCGSSNEPPERSAAQRAGCSYAQLWLAMAVEMLHTPHFPAVTLLPSPRGNASQPFCFKQSKQEILSYLVPSLAPSISLLPASVYFGREVFKKIASSTVQVSLTEADWAFGVSLGSPSSCPQGGEKAEAKGGWNQECSQHLLLLVLAFPSF